MTTYIVDTNANSTTDGFDYGNIASESADGLGLSLIEAIGLANADAGPDVIEFSAGLSGAVILLAGTTLIVDSDITVDGDIDNDGAPDITIDGSASSGIFNFNTGTSSLRGLILTNGSQVIGGAINATSAVTLEIIHSEITGSTASALGGGIFNSGTLTITESVISGNSVVGQGGGILSSGNLTLVNVTVEGNTATSNGGGVFVSGSAALTIVSSTITGNASGAGDEVFISTTAGVTIANSIILGDGNDVFISGTPTIIASIVGSSASITPADVFAAVDGATGGGVLADNGGGIRTVALRIDPSNPALDSGDVTQPGTPGTDARGEARFDFAGVGNDGVSFLDMGAFEAQPVAETPSLIVTTLTDVVDEFDGLTSLREALAFANDPTTGNAGTGDADGVDGDNDTITFDPSLAPGGVISLVNGQLTITSDVTIDGDIDGDNKADITIDGGNATRVFKIDSGTTEIRSLEIANGQSIGGFDVGGGIYAAALTSLNVLNSTFSGGGGTFGGAIFTYGAASIANTTFVGNSVTIVGGAIAGAGTVTVENSTFAGNSAGYRGGAAETTGTLTILNSTFTGNSAGDRGGAIDSNTLPGSITITNSLFAGNSAPDSPDIGVAYTATGNNLFGGTPADIFVAIDGVTGGGLLADNGGTVQTVALKNDAANPALDAGDDTLDTATDARGEARFDFAGVANNGANISDLGAFELQVPAISIDDVIVNEGDGTATFTVSLSVASAEAVTVDYATANDTANAGDYTATSGTLTFAAGETSKTITVAITDDTRDEPAQDFVVNLSNAIGGTIADGQGVGTIQNNDAPPTISIADASIVEGDSGTTSVAITATLSGASEYANARVDFSLGAGTATSGTDYGNLSVTSFINFPFDNGATFTTFVPIFGDTDFEGNETFLVNVSSNRALTVDGQAVVTILNDDTEISIDDVIVNEGDGTATFTVSLSTALGVSTSVDFATANDTANAGDYTATSGTLTFAAGETSKTITVAITDDTRDEPDQDFFVNLSNATVGTLADSQGVGTIQDNDDKPTITVAESSIVEGDSGETSLQIVATIHGGSEFSGSVVTFAVEPITTSADDHEELTTITTYIGFPLNDGSTFNTSLLISGDTVPEADETLRIIATVTTSEGSNSGSAIFTIIDNDANIPPSGTDKTVGTQEDTAFVFALADFGFSDALDSPANAFAAVKITTLPGDGSLELAGVPVMAGDTVPAASITAGDLRFVPDANSNGAPYASFTFQVQDDGGTQFGGVDTDPSANTMTIDVAAVADAPVAPATNSVATDEDTPSAPVAIGASDADGDISSYKVKDGAGPAKGSVIFYGDTFVYTPAPHANGADSFTIVVRDKTGLTTEQVVSVAIAPVADAPAAIDDTLSPGAGGQIATALILANDVDVDGDPISVIAVANAVGGAVSLSGSTITFTPTPGHAGAYGFDYTIGDGTGLTDSAHVTLTGVAGGGGGGNGGGNQPPVIAPVAPLVTFTGIAAALQVSASDADGDPLTFGATGAAHGDVTGGSGGAFVYTPDAGYAGADNFTVTAGDGQGGSASGAVAVSVIELPTAIEWTAHAPARHVGEVGGTGLYVGTRGFQEVTVLDLPGLVTFDETAALANPARIYIAAGSQDYGPVPGGSATELYGSNAAERVSLAADANVALDASFVRDNDVVAIAGNASDYAISSTLAGLVVTSAAGAYIRIPSFAAGGGLDLEFADTTLHLGTEDGASFTIGTQAITPAPLLIGGGAPGGASSGALVYRGGDLVHLPGDAGEWRIVKTDGGALLTDGDTHVLIPLGQSGVLLAFDDGARTLAFDPFTGQDMIGTQALGAVLVPVTAPAQAIALPAGGNPALEADLMLEPGGEVTLGGTFAVTGTASAETVHLLGGMFRFDDTFGHGNDTITFDAATGAFTALRDSASLVLDSTTLDARIPGGASGTTLAFANEDRDLVYLIDTDTMTLGAQTITTIATPLIA